MHIVDVTLFFAPSRSRSRARSPRNGPRVMLRSPCCSPARIRVGSAAHRTRDGRDRADL